MKSKALRTILLIFLVVTIILSGCSSKTENNQDTSKEKQSEMVSLKIGMLPSTDSFPLVVAKNNHYFDDQNLDVELVLFQSPIERDTAIQAGEIDGTVSDLISTALLYDAGTKVLVTSITLGATPEEGPFAILAAPNKNITQLSDLKGKKVGISTNTIIEYVTDGLLKEAGVSPDEVEKTMVAKIPVRVEMLLNGQLDAATLPDPMLSFAVAKGAKIIAEDTKTNLSQAVLTMTEKALTEKSDGIKRFFTAYSQAVTEINSSPEKYRELFVKETRVPDEVKETITVPSFSPPQLPKTEEIDNVLQWLNEKQQLKTEIKDQDLLAQDLY